MITDIAKAKKYGFVPLSTVKDKLYREAKIYITIKFNDELFDRALELMKSATIDDAETMTCVNDNYIFTKEGGVYDYANYPIENIYVKVFSYGKLSDKVSLTLSLCSLSGLSHSKYSSCSGASSTS